MTAKKKISEENLIRANHAIHKIEEYTQELRRIAFRVHYDREPKDGEEEHIPYKKILREEIWNYD